MIFFFIEVEALTVVLYIFLLWLYDLRIIPVDIIYCLIVIWQLHLENNVIKQIIKLSLVHPSSYQATLFNTFNALFSCTKFLSLAQQFHAHIIINGLYREVFYGSNITNAYVQSGSLPLATEAFVRSLQRIFTLGTPSSPVTQKAVSMIMFWSFFETCEVTAMQLIASTWCLPLKRVRGWCFFIMGDCFIVCHQIWVGRRPVYCASSFGHVRWVGFSKWCSQVVWRYSYISSVMWGFIIKVYLKSSQEPRVF